MIRSFRHKGLRALHERRDASGVRADHAARLRRLLATLDVAQSPTEMDQPGNRLHYLKQGKYSGYWSVRVSGNWRLIFQFSEQGAELVDYLDYH
ncbi:type II toxin-antitoxin system RelE/ParE family toxin [Pseudomonas aeruginosa]|uniref:Killer protein n=1 Tax=Phytopseudomonas dryadis TaxID=2487520 RepID=A0A4Q9QWA2_9GAMM|nr:MULTISPECIES: type II toxin-antitoxin system RelE/ParE family toxin [Pseudomonas]TBU88454.1 Killer protein [Pseudomonas dryadis]WCV81054.1 type II toxin-antitoxin system RelE/ParE family toxin [Pseudomonas aeruginosa]HBO0859778.1 type II toxin-antitoxin system RelE/ParE family toxin [Pseudomonas aeruginosa]HCE6879330.1 type II toxin-antitoxin system RelE/ParE family toxin [Pseudomonas aeruginosa]HDR2971917.1 type II toxin-antitoxin system RelE/ParE family toxin [Pseudomonas aeruginosa]